MHFWQHDAIIVLATRGAAWQDGAGQGGAGHGEARLGAARQGRAGQGQAGRGPAGHGKARQGKEIYTNLKKGEQMYKASVILKSTTPYSQSRHHGISREPKETSKDHEARTWRFRLHTTKDGHVFIPPMAFKNNLSEIAKFLGIQIPGKGKATFTKHFESGVQVMTPLILPVLAKDVAGEWLFVPADGRRGSGKRVEKCFPVIPEWEGIVEYFVLDETITLEVFREHIMEAGKFIGIGRFRPRNNGYYGRFEVGEITWDKIVVGG